MIESPLATVAMVTYNSAKYVAQAIESVLCQSYENLELVICDDCSTDGTWDIIQSYSDSRIRAFRNSTNLREYPNRNKAASLAHGAYLIYIDGDDILYPHGLDFMVRMLDAFPDAAMAMARPWSEKFVYPVELTPREVYLAEYLGLGVIAINFAHLLFRTEILRSVGGLNTRYKTGDVWIQHTIARAHNSLLISDGLAWWRRTPGQASEKVLRNPIWRAESVRYRREFLTNPECPLNGKEIELALANLNGRFVRMALRYILRGRRADAVRLLRQAGIPPSAWRYALTPARYSYMADVSAENPLSSESKLNPFAKFPKGTCE